MLRMRSMQVIIARSLSRITTTRSKTFRRKHSHPGGCSSLTLDICPLVPPVGELTNGRTDHQRPNNFPSLKKKSLPRPVAPNVAIDPNPLVRTLAEWTFRRMTQSRSTDDQFGGAFPRLPLSSRLLQRIEELSALGLRPVRSIVTPVSTPTRSEEVSVRDVNEASRVFGWR